MTDSPDFDTMAVETLIDQADLLTPDDAVWYDALKTRIADQLRHVWNARGAADLAALEAAHNGPIDQCGRDGTVNLERALRRVDVLPCACGCGTLVPGGLMECAHPDDYRDEQG